MKRWLDSCQRFLIVIRVDNQRERDYGSLYRQLLVFLSWNLVFAYLFMSFSNMFLSKLSCLVRRVTKWPNMQNETLTRRGQYI